MNSEKSSFLLIDVQVNILSGVFSSLLLCADSSFLSSQKIISIFIDLQFGDDDLGGVDGDVDGGTFKS
jgi:hypothetical protein